MGADSATLKDREIAGGHILASCMNFYRKMPGLRLWPRLWTTHAGGKIETQSVLRNDNFQSHILAFALDFDFNF